MTPIFYNPKQSSTEAASYSPSAGKPAIVVNDWMMHEVISQRVEVHDFEPVSRELLYRVHDKAYVDGVLDCTLENGFDNKNKGIADSLPYTVGSIVAATMHVLHQQGNRNNKVAVSPTSGFHHAGYNYGGGYCTFNGLMAAAVYAHEYGLAKRILILDMDNHYGDGTEDIIQKLGIDYITHITSGKSYHTAEEALAEISILTTVKFDLCLYQAGADIHVDDPLGGKMTTEEMISRDRRVFNNAIMSQTPLVWNLAGGYQKDKQGTIAPVINLHRNTMLACVREL